MPINIPDSLTLNEDESYYTNASKNFKFFAVGINNLSNISPNNNAVISEIFEGWNVDIVVISNGVITVLDALNIGDRYFIRFTLHENYLLINGTDAVTTISGQDANEYYSIVKTYLG